jgi:hypothetical protein
MQIPEGLPTWVPYVGPLYWALISVPAILAISLAIGYRFSRDGQVAFAREHGQSVRISRGLGFFAGFALSTVALGWFATAFQSVVNAWAFLQYAFRMNAQLGIAGSGQRNWQPDLLLVGIIETLVLAGVVSLIVAPPRRPVLDDSDETAPVGRPLAPEPTRPLPRLGTSEPR